MKTLKTLGQIMGLDKIDPEEFKGACGVCTDCGEWTDVLYPCCNAAVYYQGSLYFAEDFACAHPQYVNNTCTHCGHNNTKSVPNDIKIVK